MIPPTNEGEESEHSTIETAVNLLGKPLHVNRHEECRASGNSNKEARPTRHRRSVRFHDKGIQIIHNKAEPLTNQEIEAVWYSEQDFSDFRRQMRRDVCKLRQNSAQHDGGEAIRFFSHVHYVFTCMDFVCEDYRDILGPTTLQRLQRVSETNLDRTGLESRFAILLKQDGNERRHIQQDVVYEIQTEYYNGDYASEKEMRRDLQGCCEANSQVSVLLAQVIAQVQYLNTTMEGRRQDLVVLEEEESHLQNRDLPQQ